MKKTYLMIILGCIYIMIFSGIAAAGDYDYKADDTVGDVDNTDIDITHAKVGEDNNNIIFTLKVVGTINSADWETKYYFSIVSTNNSKNPMIYCLPYFDTCYLWEDYSTISNHYYNIENNILNITVPKSNLSDYPVPWEITAYAEMSGGVNDTTNLEKYTPDTNGDGNGDGDGDGDTGDSKEKDKGLPGFEMITVILASLVAILIWKRRFS
jgi:hypothetical protein